MTPEDILMVLKEATNTFGDIAVKLTDNNMSCMYRTILPILLKIPYGQLDATQNLSGLITTSAK